MNNMNVERSTCPVLVVLYLLSTSLNGKSNISLNIIDTSGSSRVELVPHIRDYEWAKEYCRIYRYPFLVSFKDAFDA